MADPLPIIESILILIAFGIVTIVIHWTAKIRGYFKWGSPTQLASFAFPHILFAFAIFFIGSFALFQLVSLLLSFALNTARIENVPHEVIAYSSQAISTFCVIFLIFIFLTASHRKTFFSILKDYSTPHHNPISYDIGIGFLSWLISFPSIAFVSHLMTLFLYLVFQETGPQQNAIMLLQKARHYPIAMTFISFSIVCLAPLLEELLFRGLLQRWLSTKVSRIYAILIASLCFSSLHFSLLQGIANFSLIPTLFVLSIYLGYIYERQRSLIAPFILHATFNSISVLRILIT
ncbi:MAG: CPBP family intramembrane metalloprotease [Simkaniaceae bacterium]|nr:CPBP family intramembrane metalloprotease [Simkaniaceae bacterium]